MGRGSSKLGGGASGGGLSVSGGLQLGSGTAEFDGTLQYGSKDSALGSAERKAVEAWEAKRVNGKVEYGYGVDENGNPLGKEKRGGRGSVKTPYSMHSRGTFTHNHPRDTDNLLGGTFSYADTKAFAITSGRTMRAAAKEGTYSISKTSKFDAQGFLNFSRKVDSEMNSKSNAAAKAIKADFLAGKITGEAAVKQANKSFNSLLVEAHNQYLEGQKKYGYTYTLEKR